MKKNLDKTAKPSLVLRREHIRALTPAELQKAVGGMMQQPTTSDTCHLATAKLDGTCA